MPTPLEEIEAGIRTKSFKKVAKGLARLSGVKVEVPDEAPEPKLPRAAADALRFYAEAGNWVRGGDAFEPTPAIVARDKGAIARKALADLPQDDEEPRTLLVATEADLEGIEAEAEDEEAEEPQKPAPKARGKGPASFDPAQFHIEHGPRQARGRREAEDADSDDADDVAEEGGKNYCRKEPFKPGLKNTFVPAEEMAPGELKTTQWLNETVRPSPRREAAEVRLVTVTCRLCDKKKKVGPEDAPVAIGGQRSSYTCPSCLRTARERD